MQIITINIGTHEKECEVPESWNDLTDEQFLFCLSHYVGPEHTPAAIIRHFLDPDEEADFFLMPLHYNALYEGAFSWLRSFDSLRSWLPSTIVINDGRECRPPLPDFSNVTWEEFMYADTLAQRGQWIAVAACLYRPLAEGATEDDEPRVPFSSWGVNARLPLFGNIDAATQAAVEICYCSLKTRLAARYPNLFGMSKASNGGKPSSWMEISHTILGDTVWNEEQLHHTCVCEVLSMLDRKIKESKEEGRR